MSVWDYRVIVDRPTDKYPMLTVHEVYYDEAGAVTAWTAEPANAIGTSLQELRDELILHAKATAKPLLMVQGDTLVEVPK